MPKFNVVIQERRNLIFVVEAANGYDAAIKVGMRQAAGDAPDHVHVLSSVVNKPHQPIEDTGTTAVRVDNSLLSPSTVKP